jgi:hypothetical protein
MSYSCEESGTILSRQSLYFAISTGGSSVGNMIQIFQKASKNNDPLAMDYGNPSVPITVSN